MRSIHLQTFPTTFSVTANWVPPAPGSFKLNCDGSVKDNGREAGCGAVLRDSGGNFVMGFSRKLHACDALEAELQAILFGISLVWNRGYNTIMVETDSSTAHELLSIGCSWSHPCKQMVDEILLIGEDDIHLSWNLVGRESNIVADKLAKHSHIIGGNSVIFNESPAFLFDSLYADGGGLSGPVSII